MRSPYAFPIILTPRSEKRRAAGMLFYAGVQTLAIERAIKIFGCLMQKKSGRLFYSDLALE